MPGWHSQYIITFCRTESSRCLWVFREVGGGECIGREWEWLSPPTCLWCTGNRIFWTKGQTLTDAAKKKVLGLFKVVQFPRVHIFPDHALAAWSSKASSSVYLVLAWFLLSVKLILINCTSYLIEAMGDQDWPSSNSYTGWLLWICIKFLPAATLKENIPLVFYNLRPSLLHWLSHIPEYLIKICLFL